MPRPPGWLRKQPSNGGIAMTVCIAAIARDSSIVAVSDQMISMDDGTFCADSALIKVERFHPSWRFMYADDIGVAPSLVDRMAELCRTPTLTVAQVRTATIRACEDEKKARKVDSLRCQLLLFGFDDAGPHVLITIDNPKVQTAVEDFTRVGYWAIGSGAQAALTSLVMRRHKPQQGLPGSIYAVCEAKFTAQALGVVGVGSSTCILVYHSDLTFRSLNNDRTKQILRRAWEQYGRPQPADVCFSDIQREIEAVVPKQMDGDDAEATPSSGG